MIEGAALEKILPETRQHMTNLKKIIPEKRKHVHPTNNN
jgi:hypothetical protein